MPDHPKWPEVTTHDFIEYVLPKGELVIEGLAGQYRRPQACPRAQLFCNVQPQSSAYSCRGTNMLVGVIRHFTLLLPWLLENAFNYTIRRMHREKRS